MNEARINIDGVVMQEPKVAQYQNGNPYMRMNVAVKTTKKQEGAQYVDSDYYSVTLNGKLCEWNMGKIRKGNTVSVEGGFCMGQPYLSNTDNKYHVSGLIDANYIKITGMRNMGGNSGNYQNNNNNYQNNNQDYQDKQQNKNQFQQ